VAADVSVLLSTVASDEHCSIASSSSCSSGGAAASVTDSVWRAAQRAATMQRVMRQLETCAATSVPDAGRSLLYDPDDTNSSSSVVQLCTVSVVAAPRSTVCRRGPAVHRGRQLKAATSAVVPAAAAVAVERPAVAAVVRNRHVSLTPNAPDSSSSTSSNCSLKQMLVLQQPSTSTGGTASSISTALKPKPPRATDQQHGSGGDVYASVPTDSDCQDYDCTAQHVRAAEPVEPVSLLPVPLPVKGGPLLPWIGLKLLLKGQRATISKAQQSASETTHCIAQASA
jgi:hypothetical protein